MHHSFMVFPVSNTALRPTLSALIFSVFITNAMATPDLGWKDTDCHHNTCCGYYENHPIMLRRVPHNPEADLNIQAKHIHVDTQSHLADFSGGVRVTQSDRLVSADHAQQHHKTITLWQNIHAYFPGTRISATSATLNLIKKYSVFHQLTYRIMEQTPRSILNAWGQAKTAEIQPNDSIVLHQASYTTCPPHHTSWQLTAKKMVLTRQKGFGVAYHSTIRWGHTPIFYLPYLRFPLANQRISGFLSPILGYSSRHGWQFKLPFYWNIRQQTDLTWVPQYLEKRGWGLATSLRYLTPHSRGLFETDQVFSDGLAGGSHRVLMHLQHQSQWLPHWQFHLDANTASDDTLLIDFGNPFHFIEATHLLNQAQWDYDATHHHVSLRIHSDQSLNANYPAPARRLPELDWSALFHSKAHWDWGWNAQVVQFKQQKDLPEGLRMHMHPWIRFPFESKGGFLIPKLGIQSTYYHLNHDLAPDHNRFLPMISLDSGLYFDRLIQTTHHHYRQTLEPRLFYVWAPYRRQDQLPIWDTSMPPMDFHQLFRETRFTGYDRIPDANQLSLGLTSRFLDEARGETKWLLSLGTLKYFRPCLLDPTTSKSPVVAEFTYYVTPQIWGNGMLSWALHTPHPQYGHLILHIQPDVQKGLSLGYDYAQDAQHLRRVHCAITWPLTPAVSFLGHWYYNIDSGISEAYDYGFRYEQCCWGLRIMATKKLQQVQSNNRHLFENRYIIQFEFKGLTRLGNGKAMRTDSWFT